MSDSEMKFSKAEVLGIMEKILPSGAMQRIDRAQTNEFADGCGEGGVFCGPKGTGQQR